MSIYKEIANCFSLFQHRKFNEAINSVDALLELPSTPKTDSDILKLLNNYLIGCVETRQYQRGIEKFMFIADTAYLNPHIFHNAACLFALTGQSEQAIKQLQFAKKFGGRDLISAFKNDSDLQSLFESPAYHLILQEPYTDVSCQFYQLPVDGIFNPQFRLLSKKEMISMYFMAKASFEDGLKEQLKQGLQTWKSESGWNPIHELSKANSMDWYDETRICADWIEIHLVEVVNHQNVMESAVAWVAGSGIELAHSFFVKRTRSEASWGNIELEVTEHDPGIDVTSDEELMTYGFSADENVRPKAEYPGHRYFIGHHNGSCAGELRTTTRCKNMVICYGLVTGKLLEQNARSIAIYQFVQSSLGRFFEGYLPFVLNASGEHHVDRIEKNGRIGYFFEILNDSLLIEKYNRYVFRIKEAELFEVVYSAILKFGLVSTVFWRRDSFTSFQLWEKTDLKKAKPFPQPFCSLASQDMPDKR